MTRRTVWAVLAAALLLPVLAFSQAPAENRQTLDLLAAFTRLDRELDEPTTR
jgi:hypothetical protein